MRPQECVLIMMMLAMPTFSARADDSLTAEIALGDDRGHVICLLYNSENGFPKDQEKASAKVVVKSSNKRATCQFSSVKPGEYALFVIHDQNDNGKLDRNFIGIPTEGVGVSSDDGKQHFGPPKFQNAKFRYDGGAKAIQILVHYP